jgi:radical SAM protein with 4Fe4S-binding SPASM domain
MSDNLRIDSHKLIYHPDVVARWLRGENIYPIEIEVSLSSGCNHRCIFCSFEYMNHNSKFLDTKILVDNLSELVSKGLKSVVYAGDGEPLLHKDAPEIINKTKAYGIDVAMSTNGVLLTPEVSKECLKSLTWIRFSTAGITDQTYNKIQRGREGDLERVLSNMQEAVRVKRDQKLKTTIGVQLLLLPDNKDELVQMGKELRKIGVDYFTIKPFLQHPQNQHIIQVDYQEMIELGKSVKTLETDEFKVYFRSHTMKNISCDRGYTQCLALPFMVYINADGDVYSCIRILGRGELKYGNLYEEKFCSIWEGERRKEVASYLLDMDLDENCGKICRMDEMNKYLHELRHPGEHVNFI